MKRTVLFFFFSIFSISLFSPYAKAESSKETNKVSIEKKQLQANNAPSKKKHSAKHTLKKRALKKRKIEKTQRSTKKLSHHTVEVITPDEGLANGVSIPAALLVDGEVLTYIAGTPVVSSPYTGQRPAFDGSDYIVNVSSINRDVRMMEQRRRLVDSYLAMGYPAPDRPIIALSGKAEPVVTLSRQYAGDISGDLSLGSSELDATAIVNPNIEGFVGIAFDSSPPDIGGPRVSNSSFNLNLGFVNVGNLDETPFYFTAGQLFAPFGRYSSSMISPPLTMILARVKTRPFIVGYKSQGVGGPYAALYGFVSDTTRSSPGVGGVNAGYILARGPIFGDIGAGVIGSITDSHGMQLTGSTPTTTFGGFAAPLNGSEYVAQIPGFDGHINLNIDRYNIALEWVGATKSFSPGALSYNGIGAKPEAGQIEGSMTFYAFDRPSSFGVGYQWTKDALALNLPKHRVIGAFSISIWKDTVESIEYRRDEDYAPGTYANGAATPGFFNQNTLGTGRVSNTVFGRIGVYF